VSKLSVKENFLETVKKGGKPDAIVVQWGPLMAFPPRDMVEPCYTFMANGLRPGVNIVNRWGVEVLWPPGQPGGTPLITEENKVIKDITRWRDYFNEPDIEEATKEGWEPALARVKQIREEGGMAVAFMPNGMFEQMHFMMGFEDALAGLLEDPEDCHELLDAICEFKCKHARILVEKYDFDAILTHDDWGAKNTMFMSPDTWREFFKERYTKFFKIFRDAGILVVHHADSYLEPIVEDLVDIGIDVWQGVLPQNDIPKIQKQLGGRMALMGGIDNAIVEAHGVTEEEIRAEVRRVCEQYVPGGNFIPCLPSGTRNGSINPETDKIMDDEIQKCCERGVLNA